MKIKDVVIYAQTVYTLDTILGQQHIKGWDEEELAALRN